jgi:hypothetical protein
MRAVPTLVALGMLLGFAAVVVRWGLSPQLTIAMCVALTAAAGRLTSRTVSRQRPVRRRRTPDPAGAPQSGVSRGNERPPFP